MKHCSPIYITIIYQNIPYRQRLDIFLDFRGIGKCHRRVVTAGHRNAQYAGTVSQPVRCGVGKLFRDLFAAAHGLYSRAGVVECIVVVAVGSQSQAAVYTFDISRIAYPQRISGVGVTVIA